MQVINTNFQEKLLATSLGGKKRFFLKEPITVFKNAVFCICIVFKARPHLKIDNLYSVLYWIKIAEEYF